LSIPRNRRLSTSRALPAGRSATHAWKCSIRPKAKPPPMLERAGTAPAASAGAAANRLKGSARAIGAGRLARAAESFERAIV
jgi:hypothetical protein